MACSRKRAEVTSSETPDELVHRLFENHGATASVVHAAAETVRRLVSVLGYSNGFLSTRLHLLDSVERSSSQKHAVGFRLDCANGSPFMYVLIATQGGEKSCIPALKSLMMASQTVSLGVCDSGQAAEMQYLRRAFNPDRCEFTQKLEPWREQLHELIRHQSSPPGEHRGHLSSGSLRPLPDNLEAILFEAHSLIRDSDAFTPSEALEEICKFLALKAYDERIRKSGESYVCQTWAYGSKDELASAMRSLYFETIANSQNEQSDADDEKKESNVVPPQGLRLSGTAIAGLVALFQDFSLQLTSVDLKGRAFQRVIQPAARSGMGQFFTPAPVVDFMCRVVQPSSVDLVLDPFCGSGHFLDSCLRTVEARSTNHDNRDAIQAFACRHLYGIEKSATMVRIAQAAMVLAGDGHSHIICMDALLPFENYETLRPGSFDLVLTNPPFGAKIPRSALTMLGHFDLAVGRNSVPVEVLGLERSIQFLKPGGRIGIVLPDGVLANRTTAYVRKWLQLNVSVKAIVSLPVATFQPYGANVRTSILFARKLYPGETPQESSVRLVRIDNVGYDSSGRSSGENELTMAAETLAGVLQEGW